MTGQNAGILGMGHAYPEGILTNADLEKMVDTNDEWITSRTGIRQRHKAAADEYTSQFGTKAAIQAMERAGIGPEDLDIIICATTTPDQIMPSTGALIQAQIGATNAAGMDVFAACSGFLYGLTLVDSMIRTGQVKYALVVGAEVLTKYVDYKDTEFLKKFVNEQGKILPRRLTGNSLKYQRKVSDAIKKARQMALMPFVTDLLK